MDRIIKYWPYLVFFLFCVFLVGYFHSVGLGMTHDSVAYLGAAKNLRTHHTLVVAENAAFQHWPPLFPGLLSLLGKTSVAIYRNGLWLQFGSLFLSLSFFFKLLRHNQLPVLIAIPITLVFGLSAQTLQSYYFLWSEGVFLSLFLFVFYFELKDHWVHVLLRSLLPLQRLIGVSILLSMPSKQRKKQILIVSLSVIPFLCWLIFFKSNQDYLFGPRDGANFSFWERLIQMGNQLSIWVVPSLIPTWFRIPMGLMLIGSFFWVHRTSKFTRKAGWYFLSSTALLLLAALFVDLEYFDDRFWIIQWTVFLLIVSQPYFIKHSIYKYILFIILLYNGIRGAKNVVFWKQTGGGGGFTSEQTEKKLIESHLLTNLEEIVVTNELGFIYPYLDKPNCQYYLYQGMRDLPKENCSLLLFNPSKEMKSELKHLNSFHYKIVSKLSTDLGVQYKLQYVGVNEK